jgi:hypothetical protein
MDICLGLRWILFEADNQARRQSYVMLKLSPEIGITTKRKGKRKRKEGQELNNFTRNDPSYDAYQVAEKRVKAKISFYWHLASYIVVNTFLIGIYLLTSWDGNNWNWSYPWFVWTLGGWGIGLLFNFLGVFFFPDNHINRQKMINEEMQRMGVPIPTLVPTASYPPAWQTMLNPRSEQPIAEKNETKP